MQLFLSHVLDPDGYAWPGEPIVSTKQVTEIEGDCVYCSYLSTVPNHCGTHMDAPRHFVKDGLSIGQLGMEYFVHTDVALLDIPKGPVEGIYREDLEPFAETIAKVSCLLIRTGLEQYRDTNPDIYQKQGAFVAPSAGRYLSEEFPNLKVIGIDFLAIGSASPNCPEGAFPLDCHRNMLGYFTGKFVCPIEDMHLSEIPKDAKIVRLINAPLLIKGLDSSQVTCIAEIE